MSHIPVSIFSWIIWPCPARFNCTSFSKRWEDRRIRADLIRTSQFPGTAHGHAVFKFCASFCCYQIIPAIMIENVRTFCGSLIAALKYIIDRSYQLLGLWIVLLYTYAAKTFVIQSVIKKACSPATWYHQDHERERIKAHFIERDGG